MKRLTLSICFTGLFLNFGVGIPFAAEAAVNAPPEKNTFRYPLDNYRSQLTQGFGKYLYTYNGITYNGYHGGEDVGASVGTRVYPIARGKVAKLSPLGSQEKGRYLGWLIAIEHTGCFIIPARTDAAVTPNGTTVSYTRSDVSTIYSIYMHVDPRTTLKKGDDVYPDDYIATIAQTSLAAHLHFEIRLPNARHSPNTWALVGNPDNWCFNIDPKTGEVVYNGYYKDPQAMFDAGLRHPTDFIEENNKTPRTLAQACWKEYKIGDLFYSVPGHWKPGPETKDGVSTRMYYTEQGQTTFMIGVGDSLVKDYEPGKLRIVHYGMDGGEKIEESATASRTITIGHIGRMVGGFSRKIAGRPVTVCILRLTGNDNIPVENWSFALIENGKQYALSLFSRDRSFQTEIFAELVSRIHF